VGAYDVVVTTYEMVKSPSMATTLAHRMHWRYMVLDEGHVIKNEESQISKAVRGFHFQNALLLTGTPLQNNLRELFALLNFLFPEQCVFEVNQHILLNFSYS
jgi:SNF2 family DNA or RNA helicase